MFLRSQKKVHFNEINKLPEGSLLEIGVGNGAHLELYKKHKIIDIDTSDAMLEIARKQNLGNIEIIQMGGKTLLFDYELFGYVALAHVIAVIDNPAQLWDKLA